MMTRSQEWYKAVIGETVEEEVNFMSTRSSLTRLHSRIEEIPWSDIQEDYRIGGGAFCDVHKVQLNHSENKKNYYALKCLSPDTMAEDKRFATGAVDLAIEGEILSRLSHENLIRLHGTTSGGPTRAYMESERGYFLVIELLKDTLQSRFDKHRQKILRPLRSRESSSSLLDRLQSVALGVAKGMDYLHQNGVVLRDLKPDNVGFDEEGTPKIFDLGLAREFHTLNQNEIAGSLRYMAPEVANAKGAEFASDVYSYGILLWELCTLEKPYKKFETREKFMEKVVFGGWRPSFSSIPSAALRRLIQECWQEDPKARPSFSRIIEMLDVALIDSQTGTPRDKLMKAATLGSTKSTSWSKFVDRFKPSRRRATSSDEDFKITTPLPLGLHQTKISKAPLLFVHHLILQNHILIQR
jgi:serine/threonine protein kinase